MASSHLLGCSNVWHRPVLCLISTRQAPRPPKVGKCYVCYTRTNTHQHARCSWTDHAMQALSAHTYFQREPALLVVLAPVVPRTVLLPDAALLAAELLLLYTPPCRVDMVEEAATSPTRLLSTPLVRAVRGMLLLVSVLLLLIHTYSRSSRAAATCRQMVVNMVARHGRLQCFTSHNSTVASVQLFTLLLLSIRLNNTRSMADILTAETPRCVCLLLANRQRQNVGERHYACTALYLIMLSGLNRKRHCVVQRRLASALTHLLEGMPP